MQKKKSIVKVISATEAKNRFGEIIKRAYLGEEHLIIKRGGIPVVVIVPMSDYEKLINTEKIPAEAAEDLVISRKEEVARRRLVKFLERVHRKTPDVSEEEARIDIESAIKAVRAQR
jgi:prevent-host-death family protein